MNNVAPSGIYLSVVIPIYNEAPNVAKLLKEIEETLQGFSGGYEVIFIDDGSTDDTFARLAELARGKPHIKVLRFGTNLGQTAALSAGFHRARGEVLVTMDGDLQNDPHDIPRLLDAIEKGYDIASGWRKNRKDKFLSRLIPSIVANKLISMITSVNLHDYGCTLKAYRRDIIKHIELYGEMHRFIPALGKWVGATITEVVVNHRKRRYGKSKYGISRTSRVLLDLMTVKFFLSYSTQPIKVFGKLGLYSVLVGFLTFFVVLGLRIFKHMDMTGNPLLYFSILSLLAGIQFIVMGLLGEILIRTYYESQKKPIYIIKEKIN